ncbi:hypothetical protein HNR37_001179 [Desulfurispira natronophila]|uniref:Uncharacterized protein n=1 Tax=Desulfurispira natronophila TaxID=682562 RepID=A0A7W7Y4D3_9BACT|nr:hypothetical protein [Desulfurispira natronophila]
MSLDLSMLHWRGPGATKGETQKYPFQLQHFFANNQISTANTIITRKQKTRPPVQ